MTTTTTKRTMRKGSWSSCCRWSHLVQQRWVSSPHCWPRAYRQGHSCGAEHVCYDERARSHFSFIWFYVQKKNPRPRGPSRSPASTARRRRSPALPPSSASAMSWRTTTDRPAAQALCPVVQPLRLSTRAASAVVHVLLSVTVSLCHSAALRSVAAQFIYLIIL